MTPSIINQTTVTVLDSEEAAAVRRLVSAVYTSKLPISCEVDGIIVTRVSDIHGADDVTSLWPVEAILDPVDVYETVMCDYTNAFVRRGGTLVCVSRPLVARVVSRVADEAKRLQRAQTLPADGWRHYRRTREVRAPRRHVASLPASVAATHPYLDKPFDPTLRLPGGAMVLRIMRAYHDPVHPGQVVILWDVAEGHYTGCYKRIDDNRLKFLHRETINHGATSESAKNYKVAALNASNPGLDAERLLELGDWDGLKGRLFGGVFRVEDYRRGDGSTAVRAKLRKWIPVSEVPTTPVPEPELTHGYNGPLPQWPAGAKGWD